MLQIHDRDSSKTVIVFSGMAPLNHAYEWTKSFADLPVNLIGVKDPENKWYQTSFYQTLILLQRAVAALHSDFVLCLGGSAGGFAALAFGKELNANRIVAFCPQSACGQRKRDLGDHRWPDMCRLTPSNDIAGEYPQAEIHFPADDRLDIMHAGRFVANKTRLWPSGGHDLPFALKASGQLRQIIEEAIQ